MFMNSFHSNSQKKAINVYKHRKIHIHKMYVGFNSLPYPKISKTLFNSLLYHKNLQKHTAIRIGSDHPHYFNSHFLLHDLIWILRQRRLIMVFLGNLCRFYPST